MLPLAILAGLIGVGLYISRNELANTLEAPKPEKCSRGTPHSPSRPSPTGKQERAEAPGPRGPGPRVPGPRGEGMVAHFSNSQVGNTKQPPGILEYNGSAGPASAPKREIPSLGNIQPSLALPDIDRSRYTANLSQNGVTPFTAERPRGQDTEALHRAAQDRTIDELRSASNPRQVDEGRIGAPPQRSKLRGSLGDLQILSNRNQCDDTTFSPGMAATKRGTDPGEYLLPESCRDGAPLPLPGAGRAIGAKAVRDPTLRYSDSTLSIPVGGVAGGAKARDHDLDLQMFEQSMCEPERGDLAALPLGGARSTAMGTHGHATLDDMNMGNGSKANKRALTTTSPRIYGALQNVNPPKQTTYEPGDPLRTTLKETAIHDQGDGWLRGPQSTTARDPDAVARITGRETLDDVQGSHGDDGRMSGTASVYKAPVYDPNDVFDTTTRETTERNVHTGHIGTMEERGSSAAQPSLDQTQRALTQVSYFGDAARPVADGYRVAELNNPGTNRMISPDTDYRGTAGPSVPKERSSRELYTRVIGDARERVLRRRSPRGRRETLPAGADFIRASRSARSDPCLDIQPTRPAYQHQGRVQNHLTPECVGETRGGRRVTDRTPDASILSQLQDNPYVLKS